MDLLVSTSLPLLFTVTTIITILIALRYSRFNQEKRMNLPPGPRRLPVIGNLHQLIGSLPHQRMRDLSRTYGPLMHLKMGEVPMVVASSAEAAKEIMKTHDVNFAFRPKFHTISVITYGGKSLTAAPYGEYWRQIKKISTVELLSAKRVLSFRSIREEEARSLVHSISSTIATTRVTNLSKMLTSTVNNNVMTAAIGGKYKDQATFFQLMYEILEVVAGFTVADLFPSLSRLLSFFVRSKSKAEILHQQMDEIIEGIIQQNRVNKTVETDDNEHSKEDFIDVLLRLQAGGDLPFNLTTDSIKALCLDMFVAGSETSSTLLTWAMSELMKNPRVMKRAQSEVREILRDKKVITESDIRELSYLQLVVKETLRLHPPVPLLLPRECRETCEILGYTVPEKTRVAVNVWAIGRDPNYWEDAEEFKPERFEGSTTDFKGASFEFLPFGAGKRMCPGMSLGMANVELTLVQLLYHFDWKLPDGLQPENLDMTESFGLTAKRNKDLFLHAISHT